MTGGPDEAQILESLGVLLGAPELDGDGAACALELLMTSAFLPRFVNEALRTASSGTSAALRPPAERLRVLRSAHLRIDAVPVRPGAPDPVSIGTMTRHTLVGNAGAAPLRVKRWHQPNPEPQDVFDVWRRLDRLDDLVVAPGGVAAFRAVVDAYHLAADEPTMAVTASGPHHTTLRWHYDLRSLRPTRADSTDETWTRIRELLRLAEVVGDASVVPTLRGLHDHPSHFVRWAAAQTVLRISHADGIAWMRDAVNDPHVQVRAAARRVLEHEVPAWR